jgi:hypothetical protein
MSPRAVTYDGNRVMVLKSHKESLAGRLIGIALSATPSSAGTIEVQRGGQPTPQTR